MFYHYFNTREYRFQQNSLYNYKQIIFHVHIFAIGFRKPLNIKYWILTTAIKDQYQNTIKNGF